MKELLSTMKNSIILDESISIKSALKSDQILEMQKLAQAIIDAKLE